MKIKCQYFSVQPATGSQKCCGIFTNVMLDATRSDSETTDNKISTATLGRPESRSIRACNKRRSRSLGLEARKLAMRSRKKSCNKMERLPADQASLTQLLPDTSRLHHKHTKAKTDSYRVRMWDENGLGVGIRGRRQNLGQEQRRLQIFRHRGSGRGGVRSVATASWVCPSSDSTTAALRWYAGPPAPHRGMLDHRSRSSPRPANEKNPSTACWALPETWSRFQRARSISARNATTFGSRGFPGARGRPPFARPRWPGPRRTFQCPKTPRPLGPQRLWIGLCIGGSRPRGIASASGTPCQGHSQPAAEAKKRTSCHSGLVACPRIMLDP